MYVTLGVVLLSLQALQGISRGQHEDALVLA